MNEEALTKQKFTEKYGYSSRLKKDYRGILEKVDNKEQCLSDLNALLRNEWVKCCFWVQTHYSMKLANMTYEQQFDEYLKSQQ
jgi:hypothetical protein